MDRLNKLIAFLEYLEDKKIIYELNKIREGILIEVFTENQIWEIEFMIYGNIEIEVFKRDGKIFDISEIDVLFRDFGEWIRRTPISIRNLERYTRDDFFEFLKVLDNDKMYYRLRRSKEDAAILVEAVVMPDERWQIEYSSEGSIKIKKYKSDDIFWENEISDDIKESIVNS